jgi:hypothetical protein
LEQRTLFFLWQAWMLLYYRDDGAIFSPQIGRRRDRITLNSAEFWLAAYPKGGKIEEDISGKGFSFVGETISVTTK